MIGHIGLRDIKHAKPHFCELIPQNILPIIFGSNFFIICVIFKLFFKFSREKALYFSYVCISHMCVGHVG